MAGATLAPSYDDIDICKQGGKGILLPAWKDEWDWNDGLRACLYTIALIYFFLGVSIAADIFMGAIERITSRRTQRLLPSGRVITVRIWNDTVANLTLMALGSSAPEILLAVTDLFGKEMHSGELGPATIVGSASFNLFMIIALCIFVIPSNEIRKVDEVPVFFITVVFMFVAYLWLVAMVAVITPEVVDIWEALLTVALLPILVVISYMADVGWFGEAGKTMEVKGEDVEIACELLGDLNREIKDAVRATLAQNVHLIARLEAPSPADMADLRNLVKKNVIIKKSRALRRIDATRSMTGGRRVSWDAALSTTEQTIRCVGLTGTSIDDVPVALAKGNGPAILQFANEVQGLSEDLETKTIVFTRTGDLKDDAVAIFEVVGPPKVEAPEVQKRQSTKSRASLFWGNVGSVGTLRSSLCAIEVGTIVFEPGQDMATAEIKRPDGVSCCGRGARKFAIEMSHVTGRNGEENNVRLGDICRTIVVMFPESPGRLCFAYDRVLILGSKQKQTIQVMVTRVEGCSGDVSCTFRTERLQAVPGYDYTEVEGTIEMAAGVTEAFIEIEILGKETSRANNEFLLVLENPVEADFSPDNDGGEEQEILTIDIGPRDDSSKRIGHRVVRWLDQRLNFNEVLLGNEEYKEQMSSAIWCNGSYEDQQEASIQDWAFHLIALPWKLTFMFVPPTTYCGGWVCFYLSLCVIGGLTAFIGDLAELFGCVVGATKLVTAISFVALGTSMPDLFASTAAATQDANADASIVNVTGSNSVNVFLGLGLPWTVGAFYWNLRGDWDPDWVRRYPDVAAEQFASKQMVFVVHAGDLVFSVIVFSVCAVLVCIILLVRRRKVGGELGGHYPLKITASLSMVVMWIVYIFISAWWSFRQDKAESAEKIGVILTAAIVILIPFIAFLVVSRRPVPIKEEKTEEKAVSTFHPSSRPTKKSMKDKAKTISFNEAGEPQQVSFGESEDVGVSFDLDDHSKEIDDSRDPTSISEEEVVPALVNKSTQVKELGLVKQNAAVSNFPPKDVTGEVTTATDQGGCCVTCCLTPPSQPAQAGTKQLHASARPPLGGESFANVEKVDAVVHGDP